MSENKTCKNCRFRDGNVICNTCTVVFNNDVMSERFGMKSDPSNWAAMTEAQKLECNLVKLPISLSGNLDTGHVFDPQATTENIFIPQVTKKFLNEKFGIASAERKEYHKMYKTPKERAFTKIKKVIFNNPVTIVIWADGTKTRVRCGKDDVFDPEKGLAMAISKYFFGNAGWFNDVFKKFLPEETEMVVPTDLKENMEKLDNKMVTHLYSVKEFAETFGMSENTVRRNIKNGCYPEAIKEHGKWVIPYTCERKDK